jgi:hypothetical protein
MEEYNSDFGITIASPNNHSLQMEDISLNDISVNDISITVDSHLDDEKTNLTIETIETIEPIETIEQTVPIEITDVTPYKSSSIYFYSNIKNNISEKLNNQDFMQRINVSVGVVLELYRLLSSSLLILFVPQNCNGNVCSYEENIMVDDTINGVIFSNFYYSALFFNFFTLATFLFLYYIEIIRENRLIKYLDVNVELPTDDKDVEKVLQLMPIDKKNKILSIDKYYQTTGYISIGIFIINVIFSSIVVNAYYLGNQTTTTMITYVLFMFTKLSSVYNVAHTKKNIFYSAYLKTNVQYNDIDDQFKITDQ